MTGRNGKIGPVPVTPRMSLSQPHWNTATVMPVDAAKRQQAGHDRGQRDHRGAEQDSSMRKPRPTTTERKIGIALAITVLKSATIAVVPPT